MIDTTAIRRILAHGIRNDVVRWALLLWLDGADERVVENAKGKCRAKDPSKCRVHGMRYKIGSPEHRAERERQARELGYLGVDDLMKQADGVSAERINSILGGSSDQCKAHEGLAVLRRKPTITDAGGRQASFERLVEEHYTQGTRREGNIPKLANLRTLPLAIKAIKTDKNPETKFLRGGLFDVANGNVNFSRGTERVYKTPVNGGRLMAFVYIDSGKVSGWHIRK